MRLDYSGPLPAEQKASPAAQPVAMGPRSAALELRVRRAQPARRTVSHHRRAAPRRVEQRGWPAATVPQDAELRQAALMLAGSWVVTASRAVWRALAQPAPARHGAEAEAAPGKASVSAGRLEVARCEMAPLGVAPALPALLGQALPAGPQELRQQPAQGQVSAGLPRSRGERGTPHCTPRSEPERPLRAPWRDRLGRWWRNWGT